MSTASAPTEALALNEVLKQYRNVFDNLVVQSIENHERMIQINPLTDENMELCMNEKIDNSVLGIDVHVFHSLEGYPSSSSKLDPGNVSALREFFFKNNIAGIYDRFKNVPDDSNKNELMESFIKNNISNIVKKIQIVSKYCVCERINGDKRYLAICNVMNPRKDIIFKESEVDKSTYQFRTPTSVIIGNTHDNYLKYYLSLKFELIRMGMYNDKIASKLNREANAPLPNVFSGGLVHFMQEIRRIVYEQKIVIQNMTDIELYHCIYLDNYLTTSSPDATNFRGKYIAGINALITIYQSNDVLKKLLDVVMAAIENSNTLALCTDDGKSGSSVALCADDGKSSSSVALCADDGKSGSIQPTPNEHLFRILNMYLRHMTPEESYAYTYHITVLLGLPLITSIPPLSLALETVVNQYMERAKNLPLGSMMVGAGREISLCQDEKGVPLCKDGNDMKAGGFLNTSNLVRSLDKKFEDIVNRKKKRSKTLHMRHRGTKRNGLGRMRAKR